MDKPSLNLFCSSPLFHFPGRKLLYGSILWVMCITRPLPVCKCFVITERLHSACSKRRWVFSFLSTF